MIKKKIIRTTNKEIYEKFNQLHFSDSILLENTSKQQLGKILKNFNRTDKILEIEKIGEKFIVRKRGPLDFSIYLT